MRLLTAVVAALLAFALLVVPAGAATFYSAPTARFYNSGTGPFSWSWRSADPSGPDGASAVITSNTSTWTRCVNGLGQSTASNLSDGPYRVTISDDISRDYWASRGLTWSGQTAGCATHDNPGRLTTSSEIVIDSVAPVVAPPSVVVAGNTVQISTSASDATSGISAVQWTLGDGVSRETTTTDITYAYLVPGAYRGTVRATDRAGNAAVQPFVVNIASKALSPATPTAPMVTPPAVAPKVCTPPKLKGKSLGAAKAALAKAHCKLGKVVQPKRVKKGYRLVVRSQTGRGPIKLTLVAVRKS